MTHKRVGAQARWHISEMTHKRDGAQASWRVSDMAHKRVGRKRDVVKRAVHKRVGMHPSRSYSDRDDWERTRQTCPRSRVRTSWPLWTPRWPSRRELVFTLILELYLKDNRLYMISNLLVLEGTSMPAISVTLANCELWWPLRNCSTGTMPSGAISTSSSSPVVSWTFCT